MFIQIRQQTHTFVCGISAGEASVNISTGADLVDENDLSWVACLNTGRLCHQKTTKNLAVWEDGWEG